MIIRQDKTTRGHRTCAGVIFALAASACLVGTPAASEEKPTAFKFEILPSDKTCLKILPEDDPKLRELKVKCQGLVAREQRDCIRGGGTVIQVDGQTACRTGGGSGTGTVKRGGIKLPSGNPGPTVPVGGSLGTTKVGPPAGTGCVLRPGAPPIPGDGCGSAK